MEKLKLLAYTDEKYSVQHEEKLTMQMNPNSMKFGKGIVYRENKELGATSGTNTFERYKPETLSFDFEIDCTGIVEGTVKSDRVYSKVQTLENTLYTYNSEGHRPSYVMILYGELLFKGQLKSMNVDYTLFNAHGIPLRVKVSLEFNGFRGSEEEKKKYSKLSPDMSRLIVLKEGETLAALCHKIYGDSLLVRDVARFNNLNGFRNILHGTELLFPPLKK